MKIEFELVDTYPVVLLMPENPDDRGAIDQIRGIMEPNVSHSSGQPIMLDLTNLVSMTRIIKVEPTIETIAKNVEEEKADTSPPGDESDDSSSGESNPEN